MLSPPNLPDIAPGSGTVILPASAMTLSAEDLRVRLVMAIDSDEDVVIDAGETGLVGQAVLQLLVAAQRAARNAGKDFSIIHSDAELSGRLVALGLADAIGNQAEEEG